LRIPPDPGQFAGAWDLLSSKGGHGDGIFVWVRIVTNITDMNPIVCLRDQSMSRSSV
jgi:hypothetical protein